MERMEPAEARSNVIPVEHEKDSSATRTTASNRTITYQMRVLQQPLRARACGQGAKSSADRRPVDPPPIVELKIFDGDADITFSIRANYFLFATLEHARPMAHGRVAGDRAGPPVLTGTPVAGMVYLDRPAPAGYFIFPDLSVRHEGKYRLSFSLYEELKDAGDFDKVEDASKQSAAGESHVTHRLEVKSQPFMVYSAKKFPGLTESTDLSRVVAAQGCRVRIRRDVRMRRRDTKIGSGGKEWDEYEEETAQIRARMSGTPDPNAFSNMATPHGYIDPIARPRSASNASHHSIPASLSRRTSLRELNPAFNPPHYGQAPHTPQNGYGQASPYGPSPTTQFQPLFMQQQAGMQPPPPQFQTPTYPPPPPPAPASSSAQSGYFNYAPPPAGAPPSQYGVSPGSYEPTPHTHHTPDYPSQYMQPDQRRSTHTGTPSAPYTYPAYPSMAPQQQYQPPPVSRPSPLEPKANSIAVPNSGRPAFELPPLNTTLSSNRLEASSPISAIPPPSYSAAQTPVDSHKRSYGNVFRDPYQNQPLRKGARPGSGHGLPTENTSAAQDLTAVEDDHDAQGEFDPEMMHGMRYRRADGRQIRRALPTQD